MQCEPVQLLWFTTKLGIHVPPLMNLNSWLLVWLQSQDQLATQFFCITLWKTWRATSQVVCNKGDYNPIAITSSIAEFIEDYNLANRVGGDTIVQKPVDKWEAPDANTIKLNVDAGCFDDGNTCWGMLTKDSGGRVLFATTKREDVRVNPLLAEALGLRWCLSWAKDQNFDTLIIESDAEMVVRCLHGQVSIASIENVVFDCRDLLSQMLNTRVLSIRRARNAAARGLVGVARNLGSKIWLRNVPVPVSHIICNELPVIY